MTDTPTLDARISKDGIDLTVQIPAATLRRWPPEKYHAAMEAVGTLAELIQLDDGPLADTLPAGVPDLDGDHRVLRVEAGRSAGDEEEGDEDESVGTVGEDPGPLRDLEPHTKRLLVTLSDQLGSIDDDNGYVLREAANLTGLTQPEVHKAILEAEEMKLIEVARRGRKIDRIALLPQAADYVP